MAYSNSTSDRIDELRFRNSQQSPRNDSSLLGLVSPPRNGTRMPQPLHSQDGRGGLTRRFTTDSGRVPTIATLTTQRGGQESQEYGPSVSALIVYSTHNRHCLRTIGTQAILHKIQQQLLTILHSDIPESAAGKQPPCASHLHPITLSSA